MTARLEMRVELTVETDDGEQVTVTEPHGNSYAKRITIRTPGGLLRTLRLTADEAIQLAYALLPEGYSINDPDA
jgi:hypothetical protein